jgi:hypothetical protein
LPKGERIKMRNLVLVVLVIILMPVLITAQKTNESNVESIAAASEKQLLETHLRTLYGQFLEAINQGDV